jgi:hypothetical protein
VLVIASEEQEALAPDADISQCRNAMRKERRKGPVDGKRGNMMKSIHCMGIRV